ncbi:MAG: hypothetical protein CTY15_04735 [Methylocystis sp.]|nr:MAG: hypothetical protein CTY15_04735 [Methylocystis sp.]
MRGEERLMKPWFLQKYFARDPRISGDILAALVDSLYAPYVSLALGSASAVTLSFAVAIFVDLPQLAYCAVLLAVVSALRLVSVIAYQRRDPAMNDDFETLARWETIYAVGAYAFSGALGVLNAVALSITDDSAVHMLVLTVSTGCTAGAVIRNSGIHRVALGQIIFNVIPLCAAAVMRGGAAYYVLALIFIVFAVSAFDVCFYHSSNALRVLLARRETSELTRQLEEQNRRFDAALNNMPQGLCMFDAHGRLAVANARVGHVFGIGARDLPPGLEIDEVAARLVSGGAMTQDSAALVARELHANLHSGLPACTLIQLPDGSIVSATQAPQDGGGAVVLFEDVTERQQAEARVRYLATHDMLTGLPNRTLFTQMLRDEVEAAQREQRQFAVMFIDLDRFKAINDTLGHAAGDGLLRAVSSRLGASLRTGDIAARFGGDEFVVILCNIETPEDAINFGEDLLERLSPSIIVAGQECGVSASIGVALYPANGEDEETLLKNADAAMYLAKAEGKSGVRLFSPKAKAQTLQCLTLEATIRGALARKEFLVVYQPKRNIATGAITGVEALLRWRHPELGMVQPASFIPIAEETGLIVPIGKWVLETACAQHMAWRAQGLPPLSVAVNLSPRQLYNDRIVADISEALAHCGMDPEWLELEITESMVMQDAGDAIAALRAIKQKGVKLAIDDFGTGYSSLTLVKQMPLDTIKVDRSFINDLLTDPHDRAIAEAVISLGHALKLRVVAEGVETEAQEAFLNERGCDEMQGYLLSRPLEADALLSFVSDYNHRWIGLFADRLAKKSA